MGYPEGGLPAVRKEFALSAKDFLIKADPGSAATQPEVVRQKFRGNFFFEKISRKFSRSEIIMDSMFL
jgi:hypothetical protein